MTKPSSVTAAVRTPEGVVSTRRTRVSPDADSQPTPLRPSPPVVSAPRRDG